ncbi:phage minor head protein [Lysobacter sp. GCM10012299]|uniref:phage minor head protein n=1 Tax=Lysobacter sp. GCM10012299 TaxID=3317333 RepID=UPI00361FF68C
MSSSKQQAAKQLQLKLELEVALKPKLLKLFRRIAREFRTAVAKTGRPQEAAQYRDAFAAVIAVHDKKVQSAFRARALRTTKSAEPVEDDSDAEALALLLLLWRTDQAAAAAVQITETNVGQMDDAIVEARAQLQQERVQAATDGKVTAPASNREVAALAAVLLLRKFNARAPLIALTETQAAAESTKFIEAEHESEAAGEGKPRKRWATVGDRLVRGTHADANGQTVDFDTAFIVGGAQLRYPGDRSLGAPASETMNCRCAALYTEG